MEHKSKRQSFDLKSFSTQTTFVGRYEELNTLIELGETVLAGLGRVAVVLGEPGIGKSRLISKWKEVVISNHKPDFLYWIEAHTSTFDKELAYNLLKIMLRAIIKSLTSEQSRIDQSLINTILVEKLGLLSDTQGHYLAHLLDDAFIEDGKNTIKQLSPHALQTHYKYSLKALLEYLAQNRPLIVIIEDLQWADQSSINLLVEVIPLIRNFPILFCLISRDERKSNGWRLISAARDLTDHHCIEINLEKLKEDESLALIRHLTELKEVSAEITQVIFEKSEGNPFFIEELARMIIKDDMIQQTNQGWKARGTIEFDQIPDSLQTLLATLLERLDPDARLTLRIASVIGRSYPYKLIEAILQDNHYLLQPLDQISKLEIADLVQVEQVKPELVYQFRHVLLHHAIYTSLDEAEKIKLHHLVGTKLESLYPNQTEKIASQLAHHFTLGHHPEKALMYLRMAGQIALDAYASIEAEAYLTQAIKIAKEKPVLAQLFDYLGLSLANQSRHPEAVQAWEKALVLYQEIGNTDQLAQIYARMARSTWGGLTAEDRRKSLAICLEGLQAVEGATESADLAYLIHETGRAYAFNLRHAEAKIYAEKALAMAEHLHAYEVQVEALSTIGILPTTGIDESIKVLNQAIKISEQHHLYGSGARAYNNLSAINQSLVNFRSARDYSQKSAALSEKSSLSINTIMVNQGIIACSLWLGEFDGIEKSISEMRHTLDEYPNPFERNKLNLLFVESSYHRIKADFEKAAELLTTLVELSRKAEDYARVLEGTRALVDISIDQYLLGEEKPANSDIVGVINELKSVLELGQDIPYQTIAAVYCLISTLYAIQGDIFESEKALNYAQRKYDQIESFIQNLWQLTKYNIQNTLTSLQRPNREYITLTKARLEMARQNYDQAIAHYKDCVIKFNQQEAKWWEARTKLELGSAYLYCKDPEDIELAQAAFREARITFSELKIEYFTNLSIEKLRQVRNISRAQVLAHKKLTLELAEAGRIQHSLIPTESPTCDNFQVSGVLLSAREMSGDFYDYYDLHENQLGIVIADVADKGAGAALYMAMSRSLLRTYAVEAQLSPEQVLAEVNRRLLNDTPNGIFLTAFLGILDYQSGQLTYVNAGHNPPYLINKNRGQITITPLEKTGTLVGIFPESVWRTGKITIQTGDTLVLYTDGITEAQNNSGDYFGQGQFINSLKSNLGLEAEQYRNAILENVLSFTSDAPRLDDITIVILKKEEKQL
jgi:serine phosphatase RsbU (regulator of sigma subunit)/predicted ATPase